MCGICGFNFDNKSLLKEMCSLIIHRGPDDEGYYTDSEVSIGMRRLSIIDLNTGRQPQHNEDENIWIVFNGEIYNFQELAKQLEKIGHIFSTKSDTEVIIHAYEEWGEECVKKLRGQFAFCIYDSVKNLLFIARDHIGLKPLYYYFDGTRFIFSSAIKSIFLHGIERKVDKRAFSLYLSFKYVPFNSTLFKNIFKVPPASYLLFDLKSKSFRIKKYWTLDFVVKEHKSVDILAKELRNLIEESVKLRLISDVPLGAFLSGGIDSSSIVGVMSKLIEEPVKTFSIGFEEGAPVNETKVAKSVSDYYGTDHTEITVKSTCYEILPNLVWHLDDLISDAAIVPVHLMALDAKNKITVALTGDGADEVFAGYSIYYKDKRFDLFKFLPNGLLNSMMKFYDFIPSYSMRIGLSYLNQSKTEEDQFFRAVLLTSDKEKSKIVPFQTENMIQLIKNTFLKDRNVITQFINWDLNYQLPSQYNMKSDKMTMAASLEARVPFLDREIVSWASTVPSDLKLKGNIEKYILRLAMKDILPPEILNRKKLGFGTPINLWLKTGLKEFSGELLERLQKRQQIIRPDYVKKLKRGRNNKFLAGRIWNLLMFELWYETFIENDGSKPINFEF